MCFRFYANVLCSFSIGVFSEGVPRRSAFEVLESTSAFVKEQVSPELISGATKEGELNRYCREQFKEVGLGLGLPETPWLLHAFPRTKKILVSSATQNRY